MNRKLFIGLAIVFTLLVAVFSASAAPALVGLGQAGGYSALGKAGVTNVGNSVLSGKVGADLATSITGFPPGSASGIFSAPAVNGAEADAQAAFLALAALGPGTSIGVDPTGQTLHPGVYSLGSLLLTGELTLDGKGDYVFLLSSSLGSSGSINLINGASPCDVYWQVTSGASLTGGSFVGTIIANTSVTFGSGVSLSGRALALTGNVTLIDNDINSAGCGVKPPAPTPAPITPIIVPTLTGGTIVPISTGVPYGGAAHVGVEYACQADGRLLVKVGLSAGVIVNGLGASVTSPTDTGNDRIFIYLSPGYYAWTAIPPLGRYILGEDHGVIDVPACGSATPIIPAVIFLPKTGGAPIQSDNTAATLISLGFILLVLGIRARQK